MPVCPWLSTGNSSCWHRLYYFGDGWGGKPEGKAPVAPTSIENLSALGLRVGLLSLSYRSLNMVCCVVY